MQPIAPVIQKIEEKPEPVNESNLHDSIEENIEIEDVLPPDSESS